MHRASRSLVLLLGLTLVLAAMLAYEAQRATLADGVVHLLGHPVPPGHRGAGAA